MIEADGSFEERITLWRAGSAEEAIARAEAETAEHTSAVGGYALGLYQSYHLFDEPGDGAEVFSLIRQSGLTPDTYLRTFFDTGDELQEDVPAN